MELNIKNSIKILFPNINQEDSDFLYDYTEKLINKIENFFNLNKEEQWKQNNFRDIKGVILMLLPYIDDKNRTELVDLNQFLYAKLKNTIPNSLLKEDRNTLLKTDFKYSNMALGLLQYNSDNLLELYENGKKLIYIIIEHNYTGILKTLQMMNGKYYVNWINIIPIIDYKQSELYKRTVDGYNSGSLDRDDYYGLWAGDIYNVIRNKLYNDIKQIKFLIYTYEREKFIIHHLNDHLNIDLFFKFDSYEDLPDTDKFEFEKNINQINNWLHILVFLANNYSNKTIVEKEVPEDYKKFAFESTLTQIDFTDETEDEEYSKKFVKKLAKITDEDIKSFLKNIKVKHIWNFLYESITKLKGTFLKEYLIIEKNNKFSISPTYYYPNTRINLKNIYNVAKSITHIQTGSEWRLLDSHYVALSNQDKDEFLNRFYGLSIGWLKLKYYNVGAILNDWDSIKLDLIFDILNKNGLLSQFDIDLEITDKSNYFPFSSYEIRKRLGKKLKKNKNFEEAYYYLTNDKYKNLPKIRTSKKEEVTYFKLLEDDQNWYSFYAMDWLAQINFFHHYINHRVLYVTGATGQGKSTQVPKLLMYASKAYDYKSDAKIICTQPRIPPTKGNAERISEELGVPIIQSSIFGNNKVRNNNFYVQMKHSQDSHIKNNCPHLTLKILTDGTLYEELIQNPLMKEQVFNPGKKEYVYGYKNHYDSIIIDESHEHNTNMDMILTLLRQSCLYNNALRLIVMSATMDEDEPIYRSYFRCINDNLLYPIKSSVTDANTIFMDRRFHISPPGETTQYVVIDDYYENPQYDKMNDKIGSEKIQELSYQKIVEICTKYATGEILLFLTGQAEINKAVKELNIILPQGNIALPYYSNLHQNYKEIIEKIDKNIGKIRNKREKVFEEWGPDFIEDLSVPEGIYQRAIIIATNVAEASVTIPRLKFVVDTGYAKVNSYDPKKQISILAVEKISEASRVQRKGRVGRLSDGTVYYLYPKGAREKILPKYKITQEDPSSIYLKLSVEDIDKFEPVIPNEYNPNIVESKFYKENFDTKNKENMKNDFFQKNTYFILRKQYAINNINLYWDEKYFPVDLFYNSLTRAFSGQLIENLIDTKGQFYIIHPFENNITRNIRNEIIEYNKRETKVIPELFFTESLNILKHQLVLIDINSAFETNLQNLRKTEIYKKVSDLQRALSSNIIDSNDCLTIIAATALNCVNEVLAIIIAIKSSIQINNLNFYKFLKDKLNDLLLFNLNKINTSDDIINKINKFEKEIKRNPTDIPISFKNEPETWDMLLKLYYSGNLKKKKEEIKFNVMRKIINDDFIKHTIKIKEFCNEYKYKFNEMITYLTNLSEIYLNILTIDKNLDLDLDEISPLKWVEDLKSSFVKVLSTGDIKDKIIKSFIIGRPVNYAIKLNPQNDFYDLPFAGIKGLPEEAKSSFLFYYQLTEDKRPGIVKLNFTINVTIDDFTSCNPQIFNKLEFKNYKPMKVLSDKFIEETKIIGIKTYTYDSVINNIFNTTKFVSPWENSVLPTLTEYFRNLRKKLLVI